MQHLQYGIKSPLKFAVALPSLLSKGCLTLISHMPFLSSTTPSPPPATSHNSLSQVATSLHFNSHSQNEFTDTRIHLCSTPLHEVLPVGEGKNMTQSHSNVKFLSQIKLRSTQKSALNTFNFRLHVSNHLEF